jgi:PKD repeat protein
MKIFRISLISIGFLCAFLIMVGVPSGIALADDIDDPAPPPPLTEFPGPFNSPSWELTVDNGDGNFTFSQAINNQSTPPHYTGPWYLSGWYGYGYYSWFNQDYGWQHDFPSYSLPDLLILETKLTIRAWDVDSEVWHGWEGEYDGVSGDGAWLNPQYLQGTNNTWSVTVFNVDPVALADGVLNVWLDIDMHHPYNNWATTLDYSRLDIKYTYTTNSPPYQPELSMSPTICVADTDDLVVTVMGPSPADPDGDLVTYEYRWFVDTGTGFYVDDEFAGRGNHTSNTVSGADTVLGDKWKVEVTPVSTFIVGGYTITAKGTKSEVSFTPISAVCNEPPAADPNGPYTGDEGSVVNFDGTGSTDPDGDPLSYAWDFGDGSVGAGSNPSHIYADNGTYNVCLTVTDTGELTDEGCTTAEIANVAPTVDIVSVSPVLVAVSESVVASGSFTDPGTADTHSAIWGWGDGVSDSVDPATSPVPGNHAYTEAGIYTLQLTVTDDDAGSGTDIFEYIVVYDPSAGFVTGGGWIDSPAGAYIPDPTLAGKANFGFVSKYKRGATVPEGQTEFQFQVADLNFHSSSYEWLVVTGGNYARFKGEGTINGEGSYKFMIWAGDGTGTDGADTFRIKIWYEESAIEFVVYDNGMVQPIGGGSIVIHTN